MGSRVSTPRRIPFLLGAETVNRRNFLLHSANALGSACLPVSALGALADAATSRDEYFLQITIPNGWDVLLATDPWKSDKRPDESDVHLGYALSDVKKSGEIFYGPSMEPLKKYLTRLSVINGIFVSKTSVDHAALRNYMITGSGSGAKPVAALEALSLTGAPGSWGLITNEAVPSGELKIGKSSIESLAHLSPVRGDSFTDKNSTALQNSVSEFLKAIPREKAYLNYLGKLSAHPDPVHVRGQVICAAFRAGLARAAALAIYPRSPFASLDTHTDHEKLHPQALRDVFEQIALLFNQLEGTEISAGVSLLERTTVFITSEFSRSPSLNNSRGKEHNAYTNSAMLMGPQVRPARVIGGSKLITRAHSSDGESLHVAQYVNPKTGQIIVQPENLGEGILIKPETVIANVLLAAGVASGQLRSELKQEPKLDRLLL